MKKFALLSLIAALVVPAAATAADEKIKEASPSASASGIQAEVKKIELKDGSWAQVEGDVVKVSKDGGKSWVDAPDGSWEAKDGSKLVTKGGKVAQ